MCMPQPVLGDAFPAASLIPDAQWETLLPSAVELPAEQLPAAVLVAEWVAGGVLTAPITARLAPVLLEHEEIARQPIHQLFPDLIRRDAPIAEDPAVTSTIDKQLADSEIRFWHEAAWTLATIESSWGRTDALILTACALRAAAAEAIRLAPTATAEVPRTPIAALRAIADWASGELQRDRLGEALDAARQDPHAPTEVRHALAALEATELSTLRTPFAGTYNLEAALDRLLSASGNTEIVLHRRVLASREDKLTLEEVGQLVGVTRERIRQIENQLVKRIDQLLADSEFAVIQRAIARVRDETGDCCPLEDLPRHAAVATGREPELDPRLAAHTRFLFDRAGPWHIHDEWLLHDSHMDLPGKTGLAVERLLATGPAPEGEVLDLLVKNGVPPQSAARWLERVCRCRTIDGQVVLWRGSMADKATAILDLRGEPLTPDELIEALGGDVNSRSMLGQIQSDDRFMRRGLKMYGLRRWGGEEYTTIKEEIEQEIERQGGACSLEHLIETLCSQFGVSESSVRAYAADAPFVKTPQGMITLGEGPTRFAERAIEDCRGCFRLGTHWAWRVVVDSELLRGSGRLVPTGFLQSIGMRPGDVRQMSSPVGEVMFRYGRQSTIGSLRRAAIEEGCDEGDRLFVILETESSLRFDAVPMSKIQATEGLDRLASEVGAPSAPDAVTAAAQALGLPPDEYGIDAVRRRLRARREEDLLELLPTDSAVNPTIDLMDELIGLGE